jgi:outer membrane receptor for ferrienterochelin and colicins
MKYAFTILMSLISVCTAFSQSYTLSGTVQSAYEPLKFATISVSGIKKVAATDSAGFYKITGLPAGVYTLKASALGYLPLSKPVSLPDTLLSDSGVLAIDFYLMPDSRSLNEVVITGTLKEVSRLESPVPVEVYSPSFFRKNPTPSVFDALQNVNGVRPQLNCNVCNTGDIHINGLEGPYTMILIDGMPIVSGLSSVYGLSGIPNALIERVEIVRGPASSLYGSEAVGGLINIITKKPQNSPRFSGDVFVTSWKELNSDFGLKFNAGKQAEVLTGINVFKYGSRIDKDKDNFTDVTQQDRISLFQKWNFLRKENRLFTVAARYNYEDRWGGDISWNKSFRGGDERYGESIYTNRWELIGNYRLPVKQNMLLSFSFNKHRQNSVYGTTLYQADQKIAFSQLTWDTQLNGHDLLFGTALRYTFYDDNTPATLLADGLLNNPDKVYLPGIFAQDEISLSTRHKLLLGFRYDYNSVHGNILTPRLAYKWAINDNNILRLNAGTGFRVVSLFTEEHAALTGAREVVVTEKLQPERSYNANLNYIKKMYSADGSIFGLEASLWYTHFRNQILPDYLTDSRKIIYSNLNGYAVSRGISANLDVVLTNGLKIITGGSLLDVFSKNGGVGNTGRIRPLLSEKWTATWAVSYTLSKLKLGIDYTGNIYSPMRLPRLGSLDPRSEYSPSWSLQNVQFTYSGTKDYEIFAGIKNLLDWTPAKGEPFLIARSRDPFDKAVQFNADGSVMATPDNPYALTFDPSFVYAPNQGIRGFIGVRLNIR